MDSLGNFLPPMDIPEHCRTCPALCDLMKTLVLNEVSKGASQRVATEFVMSEPPKEIIDVVAEALETSTEQAQEALKLAQQVLGDTVEESFRESDKQEQASLMAANALINNCEGELILQGETKLGRMVTVTVCGSLLAPIDPSVVEHTHIDRD